MRRWAPSRKLVNGGVAAIFLRAGERPIVSEVFGVWWGAVEFELRARRDPLGGAPKATISEGRVGGGELEKVG